jgi:hypothetical protein
MRTPYSAYVPDADLSTLFRNGRRQDGVNAFGVRGGRLTLPTGEFDREIDLGGSFVFPSFADAHTHPLLLPFVISLTPTLMRSGLLVVPTIARLEPMERLTLPGLMSQ